MFFSVNYVTFERVPFAVEASNLIYCLDGGAIRRITIFLYWPRFRVGGRGRLPNDTVINVAMRLESSATWRMAVV